MDQKNDEIKNIGFLPLAHLVKLLKEHPDIVHLNLMLEEDLIKMENQEKEKTHGSNNKQK